jgi:NAD(P)-dependent dehydrogenase (short-subunit alcohol dehydrogenase family)
VVTGASAGLGLPTTRMLTEHDTTVVMACRDPAKAVERARGLDPNRVAVEQLDLADQASVAAFAGRIAERYGRLDLLINNAGVMGAPASRVAAHVIPQALAQVIPQGVVLMSLVDSTRFWWSASSRGSCGGDSSARS